MPAAPCRRRLPRAPRRAGRQRRHRAHGARQRSAQRTASAAPTIRAASGRAAGAQGLVAHRQGPRPRAGAGARLARRRSRRGRRRERRPITRRPPRCGTHPGHVGCDCCGSAKRPRWTSPTCSARPTAAAPLTVTGSKTDQEGRGHVRYLGAPTMQRLSAWLSGAGIVNGGPLFRRCSRMAPPSRGASAPGQSGRSSPSAPRPPALPGACPGTRSGSAPRSRFAAAGAGLVELQEAGDWQAPTMPAHYARHQFAARGAVAQACATRSAGEHARGDGSSMARAYVGHDRLTSRAAPSERTPVSQNEKPRADGGAPRRAAIKWSRWFSVPYLRLEKAAAKVCQGASERQSCTPTGPGESAAVIYRTLAKKNRYRPFSFTTVRS